MNAICRCRLSAVLLVGALSMAPDLRAAAVTFGSGTLEVTYQDTVNGADTRTFPLAYPEALTQSYQGTALDPEAPGIGDGRGDAGAMYDLQAFGTGSRFDVAVFHANAGDAERTLGGTVNFDFQFTTDRIVRYVLTVDPADGAANTFRANFAGIVEEINVDAFGNRSGSLVQDGVPIRKTLEGELPAGTHDLDLFLEIINGRSTTGASGSGNVAITLTPADIDPRPVIPLPPAVWSGLALLAGTGIRATLRRRLSA